MTPQDPPSDFRIKKSHKTIYIVVLSLLLIGSVAFSYWAYSGRQDFKNNVDKKIAGAVVVAKADQKTQLDAQYAELAKSPFKTFQGSPTYGSINFNYPKTWSAYVDTSSTSEPINGYFYPNEVPGIQSKTAYALRVELVDTDYAQIIQQLSSYVTQGQLTAKAYVPPKLQGKQNVLAGTYFSGQINPQDQAVRGSLVVIKVRDKTLQISSQSQNFAADFNNTILPSLTFAP